MYVRLCQKGERIVATSVVNFIEKTRGGRRERERQKEREGDDGDGGGGVLKRRRDRGRREKRRENVREGFPQGRITTHHIARSLTRSLFTLFLSLFALSS